LCAHAAPFAADLKLGSTNGWTAERIGFTNRRGVCSMVG